MYFTSAMQEQSDFRTRPEDSGEEALPLPTGTPVYESLTTRFVAFERLLTTLSAAAHSGYVKLSAPGANGIVLMRDGQLIETLFRGPHDLQRGDAAMNSIQDAVTGGLGVLDIVALEPGIVDGLHGVASGSPMYPELVASWVNAEGLVKFLRDRGFSGSLIVSSGGAQGVIIFDHGTVAAAFTTTSRDLAPDEKDVLSLCRDPQARLEVRESERRAISGDGTPLASAVSAV